MKTQNQRLERVAEWLWRFDGGHLNDPSFEFASDGLRQHFLDHAAELLALIGREGPSQPAGAAKSLEPSPESGRDSFATDQPVRGVQT